MAMDFYFSLSDLCRGWLPDHCLQMVFAQQQVGVKKMFLVLFKGSTK